MPYPAAVDTRVLQQNTGRQAAVLNIVRRARAALGDSLFAAMNNGPAWNRLVREVAEVVRIMPLWKLQTAGAPGLPVRQHGRRQHTERNVQFGTVITSELERRGVIAELASSNRVTRWAYSQTEGAGGLT